MGLYKDKNRGEKRQPGGGGRTHQLQIRPGSREIRGTPILVDDMTSGKLVLKRGNLLESTAGAMINGLAALSNDGRTLRRSGELPSQPCHLTSHLHIKLELRQQPQQRCKCIRLIEPYGCHLAKLIALVFVRCYGHHSGIRH